MSTLVINPTTEQEKEITAFLEERHIPFFKDEDDEVPEYVMAEIEKSREQVKAGNFIIHEEFVQRLSSKK